MGGVTGGRGYRWEGLAWYGFCACLVIAEREHASSPLPTKGKSIYLLEHKSNSCFDEPECVHIATVTWKVLTFLLPPFLETPALINLIT